MNNQVLILVKAISALYYNGLAEDSNSDIYNELPIMLKDIVIDNKSITGFGGEEDIISALRDTAEWMIYNKQTKYDIEELKSRLSLNMQGNGDYVLVALGSLDSTVTIVDARSKVLSNMRELRYELLRNQIKKVVGKAFGKLTFSGEFVQLSPYVTDLIGELSNLNASTEQKVTGLIGEIDFSNIENIEEALTKGSELLDETRVLDTGFQGLNEATPSGKGIQRGHLINFAGLTYNYKTGILIDMCLNIPVYNEPWMWNETKSPAIVMLSFENTKDQNITIMYKKMYQLKHGKPYVAKDVDVKVASQEIYEWFAQNGYTFKFYHYDPTNFTIYDLFHIINDLEEKGFEIHAFICDYLSLIEHNIYGESKEARIQKVYELARIFCYPKGISFITAHQLSTAAQEFAKDNPTRVTHECSTGGWYMYCKSLHIKLDGEFVMHKVRHLDNKFYLMFGRGKYRGGEDTPYTKQHFIYPFEEIGGLIPDSGKEKRALYGLPKIYGTMLAEEDYY